MADETTWEQETLALIKDAEAERQRYEQRVVSAQRALELAQERMRALKVALEAYRVKYGVPKVQEGDIDQSLRDAYTGKSVGEMVDEWADRHGDEVVLNDACKFLAALGLFRDAHQASGSISPQLKRMPNYVRVSRGYYRRVHQEPIPHINPFGEEDPEWTRLRATLP